MEHFLPNPMAAAPDTAERPHLLVHLPDNLLVCILSSLDLPSIAAAMRTCKSVLNLRTNLLHRILKNITPKDCTAPCQDDHPSLAKRVQLLTKIVLPYAKTPFVLFSDFPWCQVVQFKFQASSGHLIAHPLRHRIRDESLNVESDAPLFAIAFQNPGSSSDSPQHDISLCSHLTKIPGAHECLVVKVYTNGMLVDASKAIRLPECNFEDLISYGNAISRSGFIDRLASTRATFYGWSIPFHRLNVFSGAEAIRITWNPRASWAEDENALVRAEGCLTRVMQHEHNYLTPPCSSAWVVSTLEELWTIESFFSPNSESDVVDQRLVLNYYHFFACSGTGIPPYTPSLFLCQLPSTLKMKPPPHPALPMPGFYAADYGEHYRSRSVEVLFLRYVHVVKKSDMLVEEREASSDGSTCDRVPAEMLMLEGEDAAQLGSLTLVGTKVCGDIHVPSGASSMYVPVRGASLELIEPRIYDTGLAWSGFGCLAHPGHAHPHFAPYDLVMEMRDDINPTFQFFVTPDSDGRERAKTFHRIHF